MDKALLQQQGVNLLQQSLLAPAPIDDKLTIVTAGIVHIFDADFCRIWLIRPGDLCARDCIHAAVTKGPHVCRYRKQCLHLLASSGRYTHTDGKAHRRVPFGCYKIGLVASGEEHKFLTNDVRNEPRVHDHKWARELGLVSFAGYQLKVPGGEPLGVLALFSKHPIDAAEDAMLDGLSSSVAIITQQAAMESALRENEERFRGAFEISAIGMALVDLEGRWMKVNPSLCHILGYAEEELAGRKFAEFTHPDDLTGDMLTFSKMLSGELTFCHLEKRYIRKDGHPVWTLLSRSIVRDAAGRARYLVAQIQDISERKKAEQLLMGYQEELKRTVESRTHELLAKINELERFRKATVDREFRMQELQREVERLRAERRGA